MKQNTLSMRAEPPILNYITNIVEKLFSRWRESGSPRESLEAQITRAVRARFELMLKRSKANETK